MRGAVFVLLLAGCPHVEPATSAGEPVRTVAADGRARAVLEAGAGELDVGVRRIALGALVRGAPEPAGGPWGRRGRFDPSEYVRRTVIEALEARATEAESRSLLWDFATGPDVDAWTQGRALLALARRDPEARGRMPPAQGAAPPALLAHALLGDAAAVDALAAWLAEGDLPLELWFYGELGRSGLVALVPALVAAASAAEPEARAALIAALAGLSPEAARGPLDQLLAGEPELALDAVDALRASGGPGAVALIERVRADGDAFTRDYARMALVGLGEGDLSDALRVLGAKDVDAEIRVAALEGLGARLRREPDARGAERARSELRAALTDEDPRVQAAAIESLPGDPALRALLDDESARVRVSAAARLAT